jgi:hypothetical protein
MKKLFGLLAIFSVVFSLTACGETTTKTTTTTKQEQSLTVKEKDFVATREDDREAVYTHYSKDGQEVDSYTSLYAAIYGCVDNGDTEDYVKQKGSDEKLFINYDKFEEANADMYWWYKGGNSFGKYSPYEATYWSELRDKDYTMVMKSGVNSSALNYYNSYKTVKTTEDTTKFKFNGVDVWHICTELESSVTVDMEAYSGITKSVYEIDLSEAKIVPSYDGSDDAYAYVGFITADGDYVVNVGLRCNTRNGNWYYYAGEASIESSSIEMDDENCYLTSTWDETEKCFRPDGDVKMQMQLLTLKDEDGVEYITHRLTMTFEDGRVVVKDYEDLDLTQCGTIRFTCGLDIVSDNTLTDLMCGSEFNNLVITSATAYVLEEMLNPLVYGIGAEIGFAGEYDILNSNDEYFIGVDSARFHTILYNTATISYDFDTPGKDVYNFSYNITPADTAK